MRRKKRSASRRRSRRNPVSRRSTARRARRVYRYRGGGGLGRANPRRRRRRARRNPLVPTSLIQRGLTIAAGFLVAPRLAAMIPVELPGGKIGQYIKEFLVVSVGSQIASKALGRKYGQALFAGGVIHIGVDMLQSYVPAFGGSGVGYYWPPNSELDLMYSGTTAPAGLPEVTNGLVSGRLASRFQA